jgi:hypothetical protein
MASDSEDHRSSGVVVDAGESYAVREIDPATLEQCEMHVIARLQAFSMRSTDEGRSTTLRAVDAYVDSMRAAHFSPERVVIAIKRAVRRAGAMPEPDVSERRVGHAWDLLTEPFVSRAIRRYFECPTSLP